MKKDLHQVKREAFMSFLEAPTTTTTTDSIIKKVNSDKQDYEEVMVESANCNVCDCNIECSKSNKCGFCSSYSCKQHLRKRRAKKNKFQKICDKCEDKFVFQSYMKVQLKAEEALSVEEQIVTFKYEEILQNLQSKREKRREISFKGEQIQQKYEKKIIELNNAQNKLMSKQHQIEADQIYVHQLQEHIKRVSINFQHNFQQDFNILSQQNQKLRKQLTLIDKRCEQIRIAFQKKEKQLEEAYEKWQNYKYKKSIKDQKQEQFSDKNIGKDKNCQIY